MSKITELLRSWMTRRERVVLLNARFSGKPLAERRRAFAFPLKKGPSDQAGLYECSYSAMMEAWGRLGAGDRQAAQVSAKTDKAGSSKGCELPVVYAYPTVLKRQGDPEPATPMPVFATWAQYDQSEVPVFLNAPCACAIDRLDVDF